MDVWAHIFQNGVLEQSCMFYESHDGNPRQCSRNTCKNGGQPNLTKPEIKELVHMSSIKSMVYAIEYMGPIWGAIAINPNNI